jgi:hypothetical protein
MNSTDKISSIRNTLKPLRVRLLAHEVYQQLETLDDLREFMEHHVFAVWDNLSQLKALQHSLSCPNAAWVPNEYPQSTRIINELVTEEESDRDGNGSFTSHFELYRQAMLEAGAATHQVDRFMHLVQEEGSVAKAVKKIRLPESIENYLCMNWEITQSGKPHELAAAYFLGREDVVNQILHKLDGELVAYHSEKLGKYKKYLTRHEESSQKIQEERMLAILNELCGEDEQKWQEAELAAKKALEARFALWDGMLLISV